MAGIHVNTNPRNKMMATPQDPINVKTSPNEKRRGDLDEENDAIDKRRRLGRLSKAKQWQEWKKEMEVALQDELNVLGSFHMACKPLITIYEQDGHEEVFIDDVYGKV